jgi:hypothetical protein
MVAEPGALLSVVPPLIAGTTAAEPPSNGPGAIISGSASLPAILAVKSEVVSDSGENGYCSSTSAPVVLLSRKNVVPSVTQCHGTAGARLLSCAHVSLTRRCQLGPAGVPLDFYGDKALPVIA